jgi:hypothetical protein
MANDGRERDQRRLNASAPPCHVNEVASKPVSGPPVHI